jgi:hypothetical protein
MGEIIAVPAEREKRLNRRRLNWEGVDKIAERWRATPAWIAVAMRPEQGTYSAYFGLVSVIRQQPFGFDQPACRVILEIFAALMRQGAREILDTGAAQVLIKLGVFVAGYRCCWLLAALSAHALFLAFPPRRPLFEFDLDL